MTFPSCLVIGTGSIGQRHVRNLAGLQVPTVWATDTDPGRLASAAALGATPCRDVEEGLAHQPDLVLICTPPPLHVALARAALERGAHVFIEKPIADRTDEIPELLALAERSGRLITVGYMLRFEEGMRALRHLVVEGAIGKVLGIRAEFGQYLPDWRPSRDYRSMYTAHRDQGGGILLDASHEIDYVEWLVGPLDVVACVTGKFSDLDMDAEDTALLIGRARGVAVEVHLDCVQRHYVREARVIGSDATAHWKLYDGVTLWRPGADEPEHHPVREEPGAMYRSLLADVMAAVTSGSRFTGASGRDAARTLHVVEAAQRSARTGRFVTL